MIHSLLTIAVYLPETPIEVNRRRLEMTRSVTATSIRSQTHRDFTWVVAVHPDDPLLDDRRDVFSNAGVEARFEFYSPDLPIDDRAESAIAITPEARARVLNTSPVVDSWVEVLHRARALFPLETNGPRLLTRIDDDDSFTSDAMRRVWEAANVAGPGRRAWVFPEGFQIWGREWWRPYRHESNMFVSYQLDGVEESAPHPHAISHNRLRDYFDDVRFVDDSPAWAWFRHDLNISKLRNYKDRRPIDDPFRKRIPIDWS